MKLINHQHKIVLITIPKNACVTMRHWFHGLSSGSEALRAFEATGSRPQLDIHATCKQYLCDDIPEGYDVAVVIRNPWSRAISCFQEKFERLGWHKNMRLKTMADFVYFLDNFEDLTTCNEHWRRQTCFFEPKRITMKLHVESLQGDLDAFCDRKGIDKVILPNWKSSETRSKSKLLGRRDADKIGEMYQADASFGNYTVPTEYLTEDQTPVSGYLRIRKTARLIRSCVQMRARSDV